MPITIHGKEYVTVAERVKAIHDSALKKFDITSKVLSHNPVVVKATVVTDKGTFNGISAANPNKAIEKTSPYEVAETSAVGRALGFAGYGVVDGIATADEMVKAGATRPVRKTPVKKAPIEMAFADDKGEVARDARGHTACVGCGKVVGERVENYSTGQYGKILCMTCQTKEIAKGLKNEKE